MSTANTTERVPLTELRLLTRNPRKGNVGAVAASLQHNGQYRPLVVNIGTHTGRPNEVLKGNHTLKAMRLLAKRDPKDDRWHTALVHWVDVDEDQAKAIVMVDNRTSELGDFDTALLSEVLHDIEDLGGTGFTELELDAMTPPDFASEVDPAALDETPEPAEQFSGRGQQVISYSIVFDTMPQRQKWLDFVGWLKRQYPDNTAAERLDVYLADFAETLEDTDA